MKTGLIGYPVAHSLSPLIHRTWQDEYDVDGVYELIELRNAALAPLVERLRREGYQGVNVTVPYKREAMAVCDTLDETARLAGAVNTLVFEKDGTVRGLNTDTFGFCENVRDNSPGIDFARGPALVFGAGGAARAVVCGLLSLGAPEVRIVNRTRAHADAVAADLRALAKQGGQKVAAADWGKRESAAKGCAALVNATSLGMSGQPELPFDFSRAKLAENPVICDIVYRPLFTHFLKQAQLHGHKAVTGIGMLLHQARPAFEAWCGIMPEISEELRLRAEEEARAFAREAAKEAG
jgi:shikimate dehydrogenase